MRYSRQRSTGHASSLVFGCLQLLVRIGFVAFAVSKIVMGAKYRKDCPAQELVPIATIMSGCFQFLLYAYTWGRKDGNHPKDERYEFRKKCRFATRSIATVLNVGTWIAGTVAILHILKFTSHTCQGNSKPTDELAVFVVGTSNLSQSTNDKAISGFGSLNLNQSTNDRDNKSIILTATATLNQSSSIPHINYTPVDKNMTGKDFSEASNSEELDDGGSKRCVICSNTILVFAIISFSVDWMIGLIGTVCLCCLRFHRNKRGGEVT